MKIVIDTKPLISEDRYRGVGSYTKNLIESLKRFDKDNTYIEANFSKDAGDNVDLIIIPYFTPFQISLPFKKSTKIIVTIHDLIPLKYPENFPVGLRGKLIWQIQKKLLQQVNAILTVSYTSKKDIERICHINSNKIFTLYQAISDKFIPLKDKNSLKKIRNKYNLPQKFILYVGDCNWNKNVPLLIRAVKSLNLNLILIGKVFTQEKVDLNHPWNASLKEVLQLSAGDKHIKKLGYIPDSDLVAIYNLADLYVQPSFDEGFGLSMVEAFACGCPVIAASCKALKEIGKDAPIFFESDNKQQLINRIKELLVNNTLRMELKIKGFQQAKQYSSLKFVSSIKHVYQQII